MSGVRADHVDHAAAADDLAVLTDALDAGTYFHGFPQSARRLKIQNTSV
jgi:hypothetical protein